MLILAFDTSSKTAAVAILQDDTILYDVIINAGFHHSEVLMPAIDQACRQSKIKIQDIDLFACTLGPGSFTGLRIGTSTLKGFLSATGKPAAGVSSLAALALNAETRASLIFAVMDAGRGQVYCACYSYDDNHLLNQVGREQVVNPKEIILPEGEQNIIFVGDGAIKYQEIIKENAGRGKIAFSAQQYIRAAAVGILGREKYNRNELLDPSAFVPIYLHSADARPKKNLFES